MRGILCEESGKILHQEQKKYRPVYRSPEWIEQPASDFQNAMVEIFQLTKKWTDSAQKKIDMIAVTGQRSAVIPLGTEGMPLMPAVMWQDTRNADICRELKKEDSRILQLSGSAVNMVFSGGKIRWIKKTCPEIAEKTVKYVNIPEYLMYCMTGKLVTDHTYGSRSNLMNLKKRDWDQELLDMFGVYREELCSLQEPGTKVGEITSAFSRITGIPQGTPVITAGGDQQCAAVGQGAVSEGNMSIVVGTGAYLVLPVGEVPEDLTPRMICNCSAIAGKYILEANVLTCSSAFDWFLRNFYREAEGFEEANRNLTALYDVKEEAVVLPYFQGRSSDGWNAEARALFSNITLSTTREDILKALVEGIFLEIGNSIEKFRTYAGISEGWISGGMANSEIMNQMQADIYGLPLKHMENSEATARGALIVALTSQGIWNSAESAFQTLRASDKVVSYEPDQKKTAWYISKKSEMNRIYQKIYQ